MVARLESEIRVASRNDTKLIDLSLSNVSCYLVHYVLDRLDHKLNMKKRKALIYRHKYILTHLLRFFHEKGKIGLMQFYDLFQKLLMSAWGLFQKLSLSAFPEIFLVKKGQNLKFVSSSNVSHLMVQLPLVVVYLVSEESLVIVEMFSWHIV